MSDYHLHLHPHLPTDSGPPQGEYPPGHIEAYVEAAAAHGVTELGFTEHLYRCVESEPVLGEFWLDEPSEECAAHTIEFVREDRTLSLDDYVEAVVDAKDRGLPVKLGLEVDFFPETIGPVMELLEPYPWDYLIGSVHWIGGWWFDRCHAKDEWERRGYRKVYEQFFELEAALAESDTVDVLAHIDRVKYLGHRLPEEPLDLYDALVTAAASTGVAIEVSSAGLRHPVNEIYPAPKLLARVHDAGLDITFASDGHGPKWAAWEFEELARIALDAGFSHTARFHARRRRLEPIVDPSRAR